MTEDHPYTACYCEENIYHLARLHSTAFVVFISNEARVVPFWLNRGRLASDATTGGLVIWDYHVILVDPEKALIWDFDSAVPFPCQTEVYLQSVLRVQQSSSIMQQLHRLYRVIEASAYVKGFASDRSHMLNENNQYISPVPAYPAIVSEDGAKMKLVELFTLRGSDVDIRVLEKHPTEHGLLGVVWNEHSFLQFCRGAPNHSTSS